MAFCLCSCIVVLYWFHFFNEWQIPPSTQLESIFPFPRENSKRKWLSLVSPIVQCTKYAREKSGYLWEPVMFEKWAFALVTQSKGFVTYLVLFHHGVSVSFHSCCLSIAFLNRVLLITNGNTVFNWVWRRCWKSDIIYYEFELFLRNHISSILYRQNSACQFWELSVVRNKFCNKG